MSKGTALVAVLALLIGAGGLGIGYMNMTQPPTFDIGGILYLLEKLTPQPPQPGVVKTWYGYNDDVTSLSVISFDDPSILVNFEVNSGEWTYFSFSCTILIAKSGGPSTESHIVFRFEIDGLWYDAPAAVIEVNTSTTPLWSIGYFQNLTKLSPGSHNVTFRYIYVNLATSSSWIYDRSLLVQTLIP